MQKLYQVSGCSMEPTLRNGQIVELAEGYKDGDIVVAEHEGRFIIKRLVGDRLRGDNRALSADFFIADVRILGRAEVWTKEELEERGLHLDNLHLERVYAAWEPWRSIQFVNRGDSDREDIVFRNGKIEKRKMSDSTELSSQVIDTYDFIRYRYRITNLSVDKISLDGTNVNLERLRQNESKILSYTNNAIYLQIRNYLLVGSSIYYEIKIEREALNISPSLTLSTLNNLSLSEGSILPITGSASDADNGDVVTVKYKINSGTVRNIASGVASGTPLSFTKNLTFSNKRLRDGATEVTGDLAENVDHTLTVWAEDDKGGKSTEVTRKFRVIHNRPPVISGTNEDLGTIQSIPSKTYTVTEPEGDAFTVTEKINGKVIRSFAGVAEQENTITIPHDLWIRLQPGVQHTLAIEATDSKGMTAARTYTFVRQENKLEFKLKKPFVTDIAAKRILVTIDAVVPNGATMKIEACNNAFDASPTWEDITNHVRFNRGFLFTNTEKTAEQWGVDIRFVFEKGTATSMVIVNGFGGAFD